MKALLLPLPLLLSSCGGRLSEATEFVGVLLLFVLAFSFLFLVFDVWSEKDDSDKDVSDRRIVDTEDLAELMHDAFVTSGYLDTRNIVLWRVLKDDPQKHPERNAWRAAARAVAKRNLA